MNRLHVNFPHSNVWHCLAHRLELSVNDVVKEIETVNHFKILIDKLYLLYSPSNKNCMELEEFLYSLDVQLSHKNRVLGFEPDHGHQEGLNSLLINCF